MPRAKQLAIYQRSDGRHQVADSKGTASVRYWLDLKDFAELHAAIEWAWQQPYVADVVIH